jgi:DNA repair exonuclease SbcCD ATPase subunit
MKEEMKKSYESIINQKEEELKTIESKIKELKLQKTEVETRADNLKFWVDAFGNAGIKSYLLDSVTPFLNNKANEYLSKLAGSTMRIEFSTQTRLANGELRDKFEIRLLNNVGGDSYESNSEGEKRRIDLAISLALQDLIRSRSNSKLNILLYDEIFDSLDSVGCENAIQLLTEMQDKVESIFVITHNDILKTYFDKYLIVTKEEGSTSVRKEG